MRYEKAQVGENRCGQAQGSSAWLGTMGLCVQVGKSLGNIDSDFSRTAVGKGGLLEKDSAVQGLQAAAPFSFSP